MKLIFITGGVLSGLGKGVTAASIGHLLSHTHAVIPVKCDGYLNTDPGTMNPIEHGEVFVLEDGGEVDMDFGHYERFLNINCKSSWSLTMGKVFLSIMEAERRGDFLGKTVQFIPHVTNAIKDWWLEIARKEKADVLMVEIGGTVGDIENEMYIEAARQLKLEMPSDVIFGHLTYVPTMSAVGEQKSKPSQQSVMLLRQRGINPDLIFARSEQQLSDEARSKIALFSNLPTNCVFSAPDVEDVYELPSILEKQGLVQTLERQLGITITHSGCPWPGLLERMKNPRKEISVAIAGKYTKLEDSYASISEALKHCAAASATRIVPIFIDTEQITSKNEAQAALFGAAAVIVPGGFGSRGVEGKLHVIEYCRENDIPFLGICYGMQLAIIEFARNVCNLHGAHTTEVFADTQHPVVDILPEQLLISDKGGTMRLGTYSADVASRTLIQSLYGGDASERHRHRYEVNPIYHHVLQENGMVFGGTSRNGVLAEFMELPNKRFFVGTQGHPELKSRLEQPAPLFLGLINCALENL